MTDHDEMILLSVVITHYRNRNMLRQCLFSLAKALEHIPSEVIVVCSQYDPELIKEIEEEFNQVIFLHFKENLFHVRSVNQGLEKAKAKFVFVVNDDVVVSAPALALMLDYLNKNPEVGLLGPKQIFPDGSPQDTCFRFYHPMTVACRRTMLGQTKLGRKFLDLFLYKDKDKSTVFFVDWLMGSALLTRRSALEKIGYLDESFRHYFGDVDWARRFWECGYKVVYFPRACICHHHQKSSQSKGITNLLSNDMVRMHIRDGITYFLKWGIKIPKISEN